ncbi:MAG: GntR family transcriptional regulator [Clostridia bacterium]|nr:GntR family transcriptional regulator [Clostridia bacterium]
MKRNAALTGDVNGPKYVQVYNRLKADILSGTYPPNTYLPTEDELVSSLNVSKTTLRHAISLLRDEKMIVVRQGIGMRVQPQGRNPISNEKYKHSNDIRIELLADHPQVTTTTQPVIDIVPAEIRVAKQLQIAPGDLVNRVQRLQMVNDLVYGYIVDYIPTALVPHFQIDKGEFFYDVLEKDYGMTHESAEETISAVNAGFVEARMLDINPGSPLLFLKRVVTGPKGIFVYAENLLKPDLFQLVVSLGSFRHGE